MSQMSSSRPRKPRRNASDSRGKSSKPKPVKLRIIGGTMGGRIIQYHGADFTRPMKDNIRENLFNILGQAVRNAHCFDMFAGTGALALESLSRGATSAVLVEQNRRATEYIQKTVDSLDLQTRVRLVTGDSFRLGSQLLGPPQDETPWIVFLSPPYILWEEKLDEMNQLIQLAMVNGPPGSVLVVETEKSFDKEKLYQGNWDWREYGGTRLGFIEPGSICGMNL